MATLNPRRSSSDGPRLYCKATWLRGVSPDPRRSSAHAHRRERQSWRRSRPRLERELREASFKIADFGKFFPPHTQRSEKSSRNDNSPAFIKWSPTTAIGVINYAHNHGR